MHKACLLAESASGEALRLRTSPPAAVTGDGKLFAADGTCTHQDASLADGWGEGREGEYPLPASRFDLWTGRVDVPPAKHPNLPPGLTIDGHVQHQTLNFEQRN